MLNYANLNDVEFEELCQDIMSKKLGVKLRGFAAGRDGGIDLTDNVIERNIIVQAKHYVKTDISGLISSLKKEIPKVEKLTPNQYYICCSKELSAEKVKEIYAMFSKYMESDANIITLHEIEAFLALPENVDILRSHYKLWISSTNILQDIYSNDIFIDCDVLLSNIHSDEELFVQTVAYDRALECLSKNKTLFITGDPGVGKTVTSKMLVLYYAAYGYKVRYTTDGADLSALKRALTQDREAKEIILLDDCFGQAYFNMKETQGNELLSLVKHVNLSKNKRLILNSRITIYQEAKARTQELVKCFENKEFKVHIINMSEMTNIEKAKIFYNHLFFNKIQDEYFASIKRNKNYRRIVDHPNYNPRIIEFVSNRHRLMDITPSGYFDFILEHLNKPDKVWDDEYEHKLSKADRMLLTTLFSLTDTIAPLELVKQCFNKRIQGSSNIDITVDQFQSSLSRLQQAFIKIVDGKGKRMLSMVNPSVNDYISSRINTNTVEKADLINSAASVMQLKKLLPSDEFKLKMIKVFDDGSICNYYFESDNEKSAFITYFISFNKILDMRYQQYIFAYLSNAKNVNIYEKVTISTIRVIVHLLDDDMCAVYKINDFLSDFNILGKILSDFELGDLAEAIDYCYSLYSDQEEFIAMCENVIIEAIKLYCGCVNAEEYDFNVQECIDQAYELEYCGDEDFSEELAMDEAVERIEDTVEEMVKDKMLEYLNRLPAKIHMPDSFIEEVYISVSGAHDLAKSYIDSDYEDDRYDEVTQSDYSEIDLIFER